MAYWIALALGYSVSTAPTLPPPPQADPAAKAYYDSLPKCSTLSIDDQVWHLKACR
jgi:hypothetical protein